MFEWLLVYLQRNAWNIIWSLSILAVTYFVYKSLIRLINRRGSLLNLEPHVLNILKLVIRLIFMIVASTSVLTIFDLPTDLFIGGSALVGAAVGFGSSQTINNVVAGFYVLISQPFKVKDYVRIGTYEGQVEEISINYTSLYTPTFNLLKVPNTQVINSQILNLTHEGNIKYTFYVGFGHDHTESQIMDQVLMPAIQDFKEHCGNGDLRCPEAYLDYVDRLEKKYLVRLFIPKGEAKQLYVLQPVLLSLVMKRYELLKAE